MPINWSPLPIPEAERNQMPDYSGISYVNHCVDSKVRKIKLAFHPETAEFHLHTHLRSSTPFRAFLDYVNSLYSEPHTNFSYFDSEETNLICINADDSVIRQCLRHICSIEPQYSEIENSMHEFIEGILQRNSLPRAPDLRLMPQNIPPSTNQSRVDRLNERLNENIEVPTQYIGGISHEVMTDPVYIINGSRTRYDRPHIMRWLNSNPTDPATRQRATISNLANDDELKREIEAFVSQAEQREAANRQEQQQAQQNRPNTISRKLR